MVVRGVKGMRQNGTQILRGTPAMAANILLVEDEPKVREVTRKVLEMGGYCVLAANEPAAAALIAGDESTKIDLLLTDVIMPGMNGPELARKLRDSRPELVTLFMTGVCRMRSAAIGNPRRGTRTHSKAVYCGWPAGARRGRACYAVGSSRTDDLRRQYITSSFDLR